MVISFSFPLLSLKFDTIFIQKPYAKMTTRHNKIGTRQQSVLSCSQWNLNCIVLLDSLEIFLCEIALDVEVLADFDVRQAQEITI